MPCRDPEEAREKRQESHRRRMERDPDYQKRLYQKYRDKRLAAKRAEREADPEEARAYQRAQYAKHRERRVEDARKYRRNNREHLAAKARERYFAKHEEKKARNRELSKRPEARAKQYAYCRAWLEKNPDKRELTNAKVIINEQTGVPIRSIPKELAEAKVAQLKVSRLVREMRASGGA